MLLDYLLLLLLIQKPQRLEKIPDIINLGMKFALNTDATKIESKMPDITCLTSKLALNTKVIETEKMPDTTSFMTTPEFNRLAKISFNARIKKAVKNLVSKTQEDNTLNITDENREKVKKFQMYNLSYASGKYLFLKR